MGGEKVSYQNFEPLKTFLGGVADRIVADFHPETVLDAGCAMGHLVAALRDRGVKAYGIDISDYAISQVREDIRPYCRTASLIETPPVDFPQKFDLITNIEVIEHLYEEDALKAIANLCRYTDRILFSSSADDILEATHVNVQQPEYWMKRFAAQGFFRQADYNAGYIASAACLYRTTDIARVVEDYERNRRLDAAKLLAAGDGLSAFASTVFFNTGTGFSAENMSSINTPGHEFFHTITLPEDIKSVRFDPVEGRGCVVQNLEVISNNGPLTTENCNGIQLDHFDIFLNSDSQLLIDFKNEPTSWIKIKASIFPYDEVGLYDLFSQFRQFRQKIDNLENCLCQSEQNESSLLLQLEEYQDAYEKAAKERDKFDRAYHAVIHSTSWRVLAPVRKVMDAIKRFMKSNRVTALFYRGLVNLRHKGVKDTARLVKKWLGQKNRCKEYLSANNLTEQQKHEQRETIFSHKIKISVLVPLYNTPPLFLREMIESVQKQTYENWELCLADGSDERHKNVRDICQKYAQKDSRIHYGQLSENLGIAGNSNKCIEMATGEFIALFDHDDILHPGALFEVMKAICWQGADFVYTDEVTFGHNLNHIITAHFKPDFAPDTLRSYNYICHLSVFSRKLLDHVGWFSSEFDGSQDYDLILRLTEQAKKIVHIPKVLYYWRAHRNSTAANISAKPYTIESAKKALTQHLKRQGLTGEIVDSAVVTTYKINYEIDGNPLISILIPNKDSIEDLNQCITSIREKSTYRNYEIIIIENNSTKKETFAYYAHLKEHDNIKVVTWEDRFNYSAINNFGFTFAKGEYVLLLNNDIEVITPNWLEEMLMFAQRKDVGGVGAMLYYPDNTIQHAGVITGLGGVAGHSHKGFAKGSKGYVARLTIAQDLSAVTAACMMLSKKVYEEVGGLDESFEVAFNDVDLCMRIRKAGYLIVFTPYAELYHYESKTRGYENTPDKIRRFQGEIDRFRGRWATELAAGDPYYSPNLTLDREDFSFK